MTSVCVATSGRYKGRGYWVPPTGRPFWTDYSPCVDFTDAECLAIVGIDPAYFSGESGKDGAD